MVSRRRLLLAGLGVLCCLAAAACGTSAPAGPPAVNMSLVAPTSGATVYVRSIVVLGKVSPQDAKVLVGGRPARVRRGTFRLRVRLPLKVNHIGILASASGYRPQSLMTTVWVGRAVSMRHSASASNSTPTLPGYVVTRAETICQAANQKFASLSGPGAASAVLGIVGDKDRQLFALTGPFLRVPGVRRFIADMKAEAARVAAYVQDLRDGNVTAAAHLLHQDLVIAPTYWQDAGRLGVSDCGARVVQF